MPQDLSIAHFNHQQQSSPQTWLDFYPPTHDTLACRPNTRPTGRVNNIKETLESIEWKIDIRRQLVALADTNGAYCIICSRLPVVPYCSATCPLLRGQSSMWLKRDNAWIYFAKKDLQLYDKLHYDIHTHGHETDKRMITEWGVTTTDLLKRIEDPKNRYSKRPTVLTIRGFNQSWTFEGQWSKGSGIEAELAPDKVEPLVSDEIESPTHEETQAK